MSDNTVSVGLQIDGDASGAQAAISATEAGLQGLAAAGGEATDSSDALNAAFARLGIRSARKIEADILEVNQQLLKLASNTHLSGSEFERAFAAGQEEIRRLRAELNGASGAVAQVGQRADGMLDMMGKLAQAFFGAELAKQFIDANVELENMERTFRAITGSTQRAAAEMAYAREVADRLGLPVIAAGKAYADLSAATKGTAVEGAWTRAVFEATARAMSVAGKSASDTEGALQALSQMASKGVVSMEELRGQLGERLPGALGAVADGLGITTAQLIKLVESGRLTTEELFPALATGLDKLYGGTGAAAAQTETLTQQLAHFKNGAIEAFKTIGDTGVFDALKVAVQGLETAMVISSAMIVALGKDIGIFFAALANGDIGFRGFSAAAKQAFAEVEKEAQDKLLKTAGHNSVMAASLDESGKKAFAAAQAQAKLAAETDAAAAKAAASGSNWTLLNVAFGDVEEAGKGATKQALANTEARKAEGEAALALADAFGTEREKLLARAEATRNDAVALGELAERRREELAISKGHLAALEEEDVAMKARGEKDSEARKKQIDELKKLVEARQADADKAIGQAQASAVAAAKAETEGNAYADNSQRLGELKSAYERATLTVDVLRAAKANGVDVTRQLEAAEIKAGQAASLYRDAIADQTAKIQQNLALKQSQISVEQAGIRLAIEQQRTIAEVARAKGDEYGATQALLQIKKLEIQLAELTAQQKRAEAAATLELVKVERVRLESLGLLTEAKKLELQAQELGAKAKLIEGDIAAETAKRMRELLDATRDGGAAADEAIGGHERLAGSIDKVSSSAGRATQSLKELSHQQMLAKGMSQSEISNNLSDRQTSDVEKSAGVVKRNVATDTIDWRTEALRRGATSAQATEVANLIGDKITLEMDRVRQSYQGASSTDPYSYRLAINGAYEAALTKAMQEATGAKANLGASAASAPKATQHSTVTINLNGRSKDINLSSADDASALTDLLKQLESEAARAL